MVDFVHYTESSGPKMMRFGKYSFSSKEIQHLSAALVLITIALMVLRRDLFFVIGPINFIVIYLLTIGLGFLLHELGHKFVAQAYGYISEFRADFQMMMLAILISWFGFLFLAPGAVVILGRPTIKQNGIISVAGPLVNLGLALVFILISLIFTPTAGTLFSYIVMLGIWVNAFLGVFNMLPIWILDGKKVWAWNKTIYGLVMGALILILILSMNGLF